MLRATKFAEWFKMELKARNERTLLRRSYRIEGIRIGRSSVRSLFDPSLLTSRQLRQNQALQIWQHCMIGFAPNSRLFCGVERFASTNFVSINLFALPSNVDANENCSVDLNVVRLRLLANDKIQKYQTKMKKSYR